MPWFFADAAGAVLGVVSVRFLADEIEQRIATDLASNRVLMALVASLGLAGACFIAIVSKDSVCEVVANG